MEKLVIVDSMVEDFIRFLRLEEKSKNTIEKYTRDIKAFWTYVGVKQITKELVIEYKEKLLSDNYAIRSINSMIASMNSFFAFLGCENLKIKSIKEQLRFSVQRKKN